MIGLWPPVLFGIRKMLEINLRSPAFKIAPFSGSERTSRSQQSWRSVRLNRNILYDTRIYSMISYNDWSFRAIWCQRVSSSMSLKHNLQFLQYVIGWFSNAKVVETSLVDSRMPRLWRSHYVQHPCVGDVFCRSHVLCQLEFDKSNC